MSRLSQLAVAKRSVTLLLAFALFVAGISAWGSLQQELLPDIEFPVITVIAPFPGAGSADVAEQVAKPIEQAISGVPRLETMQSTSANSIALVIAQFSYGTNVKEATAAVEEGIAQAGLPDSVDPNVSALNINASPVIIASIAATSEGGLEQAATIARTEIVPEIQAIEGVASADITGGLEQRLVVTLDPDKLAADGISVQQVVGVLQANNLTFPSGQLTDEGAEDPGVDHRDADRRRGRRPRRRLSPAGRRARRGPAPDGSPAPSRLPRGADPDHHRRPRHRRARRGRDHRVRPDQRQPVAEPDRHQDLRCEHGRPSPQRSPRSSMRSRPATPTS